jgi:hypothetical protein
MTARTMPDPDGNLTSGIVVEEDRSSISQLANPEVPTPTVISNDERRLFESFSLMVFDFTEYEGGVFETARPRSSIQTKFSVEIAEKIDSRSVERLRVRFRFGSLSSVSFS